MTRRRQRSLFGQRVKSPILADRITIRSPGAFRESIRLLEKGGLTLTERRGLVLAQNRAGAQLGRKNLSAKERVEFEKIVKIRIPKVSKKRR